VFIDGRLQVIYAQYNYSTEYGRSVLTDVRNYFFEIQQQKKKTHLHSNSSMRFVIN